MASFDMTGIDELINELDSLEIDVDCPECDHSFKISMNDIGKHVTCPHCHSDIEIQSS